MEAARKVHEEQEDKYNRRRGATMEYAKGQLVWVKRLRPAVGGKDHPYWLGPFTVVCQVSQNSYSVQLSEEGLKDFHVDHLCPYASLVGRTIPLEYTRDLENVRAKAIETPSYPVREILGHRTREYGSLEFRTRWQGFTKDWDTWEPVESFVPAYNVRWRDYVNQQGLKIDVAKHLPPPKNPKPRGVAEEEQ
jgi:ribosomal protein L21E